MCFWGAFYGMQLLCLKVVHADCRQRIWGSLSMTQSFMGDKQCWMEHMALNSTDGLDPEGIKLRASEGLLAVDYFFPGYAVWADIIHAAADLGYDTNNLVSICVSSKSIQHHKGLTRPASLNRLSFADRIAS